MKRILVILSIVIIGVLGLTGCSSGLISYKNAAELLGLKSGQAYPLVLGEKIYGTTGTITTTSGFFTTTTTTNLSPGSAVTIIFKKDNKEWHLEIPTSKTTFVIDETAPQTVELSMTDYPSYDAGDQALCPQDSTAADCSARLTDAGEKAGLGPIIQKGLQSAVFTVSQATADQLSGKK